MVALARWVAGYYLTAWGELLNAALPPGGKLPPPERLTMARLLPGAPDAGELPAGQKARRRVLECLQQNEGELESGALRENSKVTLAVLRQMAAAGFLVLEQRDPESGIDEGDPDTEPLALTEEQTAAVDLVAQGRFGRMVSLRTPHVVNVSLDDVVGQPHNVDPGGELVEVARSMGIELGG